jgi:20S proteasome subunit alpha 3
VSSWPHKNTKPLSCSNKAKYLKKSTPSTNTSSALSPASQPTPITSSTSSENTLKYLLSYSQDYKFKYRSNVPIEEIVIYICDIKQYYTQIGGSRPFGAAFLFAGYDKNNKFQLYSTDPSGNYAGWKATAIGSNHVAANSFLKQ